MSTFQVSLGRKFVNNFTRKGRMENKFYKKMEQKGLKHLVQRNLKDGSSVILAYQNSREKYANYAIKVNSDLTSETKREVVYHMPNPGCKGTQCTRFFEDKNGNCTRFVDMMSIRKNGENIRKEILDESNLKNIIIRKKYSKEGGARPNFSLLDVDDATKIVERNELNRNLISTIVKHEDGSTTVYRNNNGDEYFFTTKK